MQRWVYDQGWSTLHDAQERSVQILIAPNSDLIIAAATAAGKTEAAFLPICSYLLTSDPSSEFGPDVLYVSPLKALINDQSDRLELMCERADIPVHRWHGDVGATRKAKAARSAGGVLLITPESLEAFLCRRGHEVHQFFGRTKYVVIDELHSFLGTPRGAQLQSLLHRIELASRRKPPRVGLSATLADMTAGQRFLRPADPGRVEVVESNTGGELQMQIRGYLGARPDPESEEIPDDQAAITEHLFGTLRGSDNLVFANRRGAVESYAAGLAELCSEQRVPNEFWPHHGNLAKADREDVERTLRDRTRSVTAVCTSTLELGVDIGTVTSVAQIGPPPSVAALRQRLGRSGRRGQPSVMRIYITEREIDARTALIDVLRCDLVQSIAMVELMVDGWLEAPRANGQNLSTLIQQTLSLIAQRGGVAPGDAHRVLCGPGPFENVTQAEFADLLRGLAAHDLVMQASDGLLLAGRQGERFINHYSFYAAFASSEEWRLVASGQTLGTLPIDHPVEVGSLLLFSARRWRISGIDTPSKTIMLESATGGNPPIFGGGGPAIAAKVRETMLAILETEAEPAYLNDGAARLLVEARSAWSNYDLSGVGVVAWGSDTMLLPWVGDDVLWAMTLALRREGLDAEPEGSMINVVDTDTATVISAMERMLAGPAPTPEELARAVENRASEKWDWALDARLSISSYGRRYLDSDAAWASLNKLLRSRVRQDADTRQEPQRTSPRANKALRRASGGDPVEFCVVDLETTGFSPRLGDRVIEVAAVRMRADGTRLAEWTTLVNPKRDVGPSRIHGIAAGDVLDAPEFVDVAGDLISLLDGAVMVAHNLRFDWSFLRAEYERAGYELPAIPAICTLRLATRVLPSTPDRSLHGCCAALGVNVGLAHAAAVDAEAAANLLSALLTRIWEDSVPNLEALDCEPLMWPAEMPRIPPSRRSHLRGHRAHVERQGAYMAERLAMTPKAAAHDSDVAAYLQVLDRALEDRQLTEVEADELCAVAEEWGISQAGLATVHCSYLHALKSTIERDGIVSAAELEDLERVSSLLGVTVEHSAPPPEVVPAASSLEGHSVCFTGEMKCQFRGARITRAVAEELARRAGLVVQPRVTKALDVLVVADPDTQSGKAKQARTYGARVIAERPFWERLGVEVS